MINKKIIAILFPLLLVGCGSGTSTSAFYQLPIVDAVAAEKIDIAPQRQIWIADINTADYLNGLGIVYQMNDVQYVMANNNLWASSLNQQLRQSLAATLNKQLPNWMASTQSVGNVGNTLTVNITGFHGRYDGMVVVRGEWILSNDHQIIKKDFNIQLAQENDGYDALVRALAQGWHQQSLAIAETIRQLPQQ